MRGKKPSGTERTARRPSKRNERRNTGQRLLTVLKSLPSGDTAKALKEASGLNTANFGKAIACLIQEGRAEACKVKKGTRKENAYKPTGK